MFSFSFLSIFKKVISKSLPRTLSACISSGVFHSTLFFSFKWATFSLCALNGHTFLCMPCDFCFVVAFVENWAFIKAANFPILCILALCQGILSLS